MSVVDAALAVPALAGADGLNPADQEQAGEEVDGEVDGGVIGQEGEVGKEADSAEGEDAPEVAVAEEDPAGEVAGEPGGNQQADGEG